MADLDAEEPLSGISDNSFIILERGSLPDSINTPSKSSEVQSFSEGDIQEKLKQLVWENDQLKETLSQNNLAIKAQLDTFYLWQKEVLKTQQAHRQKFLETKDFILKLRTENSNLKKELSEAFSIIGDEKSFTQMNKKCDGVNLKQETDSFKSANDDLTIRNEILEQENIDLREKLKYAEKEVLKLSSDLEDASRESMFLKQRNDELLKNSVGSMFHGSLPNSEARAQISNLFKQLEYERNKTAKLREKLRTANEIMSKAQNLNVLEEVDEYIKNLDDLDSSFSCQNERYSTLRSWVTLAEENIKGENPNLLGEINQLKCHISQEEKTSKEKQENVQELKDQFTRLLADYKFLQEQLNSIENNKSDSEKYKNEVCELSQQLENKEKELLLRQQECDKLKEEMEALKIQSELYRTDFEEERAARESLAGEKEGMAEKVRYLQSKLKTTEPGEEEKQDEKKEESNSFFRPYKTVNSYICPKCLFSFYSYDSCNEHVNECLNIHMYP